MKFEIKNVKYSAFASQETACFEATLYVDGEPLCIVSNTGQGGCDDYSPAKNGPDFRDMNQKINAINLELAEETITLTGGGNFASTTSNNLEIEVGKLLDRFLGMKEMKKALKRVCYVKDIEDFKKTGGFYQLTAKIKPTQDTFAKLKSADWWKPEYIIINELPEAEQMTYFGIKP